MSKKTETSTYAISSPSKTVTRVLESEFFGHHLRKEALMLPEEQNNSKLKKKFL